MEPIRYMASFLFWLKHEISCDANFVLFKQPNTILRLIPLGEKTEKIPVTQIASVATDFKVKLKPILLGAVLAVVGLSVMSSAFVVGLILLLLGAVLVTDGFEIDLVLTTTGGQSKLIDFYIFEKQKAVLAEQKINDILAGRLSDTNSREQTDRIVDAIRKQ